jgi:hypothetical protein
MPRRADNKHLDQESLPSRTATGQVQIASNATNSPSVISLSGGTGTHWVSLGWTASPSQGVMGKRVPGSVSGRAVYPDRWSAGTMYNNTDPALVAGTTHYYVVKAVDHTNSESASSSEVSARIPTP